jgi:predicted nucleic acid-binding Zn ribbon protein
LTRPGPDRSFGAVRGRGRKISSVLADALVPREEARLAAAAAAFSEACGFPLARECAARGLTRDGRLLVVARTEAWATQLETHAASICARVNARLGRLAVREIEARVGPVGE